MGIRFSLSLHIHLSLARQTQLPIISRDESFGLVGQTTHTYIYTYVCAHKQTDKQTDRQTDRQMAIETFTNSPPLLVCSRSKVIRQHGPSLRQRHACH